MKTIKIIDLLNLIVNKYDKLPKNIRFHNELYSLNPANRYVREVADDIIYFDKEYPLWNFLDFEVLIIDDTKEDNDVEKLDITDTLNIYALADKINELIDILDEIMDKLDEMEDRLGEVDK